MKDMTARMYIIDKDYRIVNVNRKTLEAYPDVQVGNFCYEALAKADGPCPLCPTKDGDITFYNPVVKQWINSDAAQMEYPGCGVCHCIQFRVYDAIRPDRTDTINAENVDEEIAELQDVTGMTCAFASYCETGNPIICANAPMAALLGYDSPEALYAGLDGLMTNVIHPADREHAKRDLDGALAPGSAFESAFRMPRRDGTWIRAAVKGKMIETRSGARALVAVCSEMTEFMERQTAMEKQNRDLLQRELTAKAFLRNMPGGYHRCADAPGFPFLHFGKSFEEITGWTREEIETQFDNLFVNLVYPDDVPICAGIVDNVNAFGYSNDIYRIRKKGGGYRWVSDSTMRAELMDETFYHGVLADVTDYVEQINEQRQLAEESSRAKSTFLFNVSHDIRTPMNAIAGFAGMIRQNPENARLVRATVEKILSANDTLMKLLNDVLELARIESGKSSVDLQPKDLHAHVDRLHQIYRQEIEAAGIRFTTENRLTDPVVLCDELKLMRIGINLLSNAKKFTPAGGSVTMGVEQLGAVHAGRADYRFFVRDTGIGMSEEFVSRAFEQFERERTSTDSGIPGSGLGLAIIKGMTDLMGGTCKIDSAPGRGTEISVRLNLAVAMQEVAQGNEVSVFGEAIRGKRVLLVEDNDFNREIARYMLETLGLVVREAENGRVAVDMLEAGSYDLVLMDIQMPVMNGYDATAAIRRSADERVARVPIVAMTANAFAEDKARCMQVGMNGHISKPIDAALLAKEIAKHLG